MNIKKCMGVWVLSAVCVAFAAVQGTAQTSEVLTARVTRKAAASKPLVQMDDAQKAAFGKLLKQAVQVMEKRGFNPQYLGWALEDWIPRAMEFEREAALAEAGEEVSFPLLTPSEERAARYAVFVSMPREYYVEHGYTQEFMERHPVEDWVLYRVQCKEALDLVYQAVEAIANESEGFEYTYLKVFTH